MNNYIISYQKVQEPLTTLEMQLPEGAFELCTLGETTYISYPEGATLPEQDPLVSSTIETPLINQGLLNEIKAASPHARLIDKRMEDKIRERYSVNDELFFARIAGGAGLGRYDITPAEQGELDAYQQYVESIREWGREQRAAIGLVTTN